MKKLFIIILAAMTLGCSALQAQAPRIRTSAPESRTAQKGKAPAAPKAQATGSSAAAPSAGSSFGRPYMALKTNVAYDAIGVLNLAYECQFSTHFSAELPVMWSFWDWKADRGLRIVALQPGVKYWFGEMDTGHAVGANLDLGWFNYRWDHRRYQSESRPLLGVSLNYAYTLSLGRGWSAEFALGVGYVNARYNTYFNIDNGALINTRTRHYFGPTRIGISLVYAL